jgi:hypothetical protein|tara:strand:- start:55 stop:318 length:264 start_codon:yes stop_codon:yes gene_type:complete
MINKTEVMLLMKYDSPVIRLNDCLTELGLQKADANRRASEYSLPVPTFRMRDSQKSPRLIHIKDLAEYIDRQHQEAKETWIRVNAGR